MKKVKSKAKMVLVYDAEDFFKKGKKARPVGKMRDPDTTFGVVLDRAAWEHLFGNRRK